MDNRLDIDNPNLFLDTLQMRKDRNKDSIIIITGERRNGKSFAAIKLAEHLDRNFDVTKNLFFNVKDFLMRWRELEGGAIILDEASENVDRRNWFSIENRLFNSLVTREGFRRNVAILTFPMISDLDTRTVRLCSHHITMIGVNQEREASYASAYRLKPVLILGKSYPAKYPMLLNFSKPSEKNVTAYAKMKTDWNAVRSQENIDTMEMLEDPDTYAKKLTPSFYISAFKSGIIDQEEFLGEMGRLGHRKKDIDLVVKMVEKRREDEKPKEIIPELEPEPNPQDLIDQKDMEEYMNAKQELEIQLLKEKVEQEKVKRYLLEMELEKIDLGQPQQIQIS